MVMSRSPLKLKWRRPSDHYVLASTLLDGNRGGEAGWLMFSVRMRATPGRSDRRW